MLYFSHGFTFLVHFYIADDVQAVLHDVQDKTRCNTGFTRFSTRLTGRSKDVYTMCTRSTHLITGSTREKKKMEIDNKSIYFFL